MQQRTNTQNRRDVLLIIALIVILGGIFVYYNWFAYNEPAAVAHIYYGSSDEPIVSINFVSQEVTIHSNQDVPDIYLENNISSYPYHDSNQQTITLLGDYTVNGVRQIVVIQYWYGTRGSIKIIEETSPNNICSLEGESTGKPLICLPNRIRVEFEKTYDENEPDFTV